MFRFYPIRFRESGRKGMTFLLVGKIYATIFFVSLPFFREFQEFRIIGGVQRKGKMGLFQVAHDGQR